MECVSSELSHCSDCVSGKCCFVGGDNNWWISHCQQGKEERQSGSYNTINIDDDDNGDRWRQYNCTVVYILTETRTRNTCRGVL